MASDQLILIRQYCDTTRIRLSGEEKNLLCLILENPARYDGFISKEYEINETRHDPQDGRFTTCRKWQYRININANLSIDQRYYFFCDVGSTDDLHWEWNNAYHITDLRRILEVLKEIRAEL